MRRNQIFLNLIQDYTLNNYYLSLYASQILQAELMLLHNECIKLTSYSELLYGFVLFLAPKLPAINLPLLIYHLLQ